MQDGWECTTAPWWVNRDELGTAYAESGPSDWMRVKASDLAKAPPRKVTPAQVSNVRTTVDKISFDVSEIGKPVEVKESYFPNWQVSGAKGPYRLAPNLMVVVPTSKHVELTYGLTTADWAGRVITVGGSRRAGAARTLDRRAALRGGRAADPRDVHERRRDGDGRRFRR